MKREEILAMEPGRELDSHVAAAVMGFKEVTIVGSYYFTEPLDTMLKSYSTDISAAWEIAEQYPIATVERVEIFEGNIEVKATLWEGFDYREHIEATAKTVPEAICKAALIAVLDPINLPGEET